MSADRCSRCARIQGAIGLLLLAPIVALYVLWLAGYGLTSGSKRRRRCAS